MFIHTYINSFWGIGGTSDNDNIFLMIFNSKLIYPYYLQCTKKGSE